MVERYAVNVLADDEIEVFFENVQTAMTSKGIMEVSGNLAEGGGFWITNSKEGQRVSIDYFRIVHIDDKSRPKRLIVKKKGCATLN